MVLLGVLENNLAGEGIEYNIVAPKTIRWIDFLVDFFRTAGGFGGHVRISVTGTSGSCLFHLLRYRYPRVEKR
jgi:hypothetical protein